MDQNIQIGFLIGVYFLASAVVALTLMYLSRPRHKSPINPTRRQTAETGPNVSEPASREKPVEKKNPAEIGQDGTHNREIGPKIATPLVQEEPPGNKNPTEIGQDNAHNNQDRPEIPAPLVQKEPPGNKNRVSTGLANLPVAQALPATPVSYILKKPPIEETKTVPPSVDVKPQPVVKPPADVKSPPAVNSPVDVKPQPAVNPPAPSVKVVNNLLNNKEEKIEMEEKPRPAKGTTDFAELFTEENDEENEVGKLASELAEIETQDILDETRNLLSRFKKKH